MHSFHIVLLALAISAPALADIETAFVWVQGSPGTNFAVMHADLDTETGDLSVWGDYQGLVGDLTAVALEDVQGQSLGAIQFTGPREGVAYGTVQLAGPALADALASGVDVQFQTTASPAGEMNGFLSFFQITSTTLSISGSQVVGTNGAPGASGTLNLTTFPDGRVSVGGNMSGIDLPITGLELRGPAWTDENGPLLLDLAPFNSSANPSSYIAQVPAGVLTGTQLDDIEEGLAYLLVRTNAYPDGAMRGQLSYGVLGDTYCANRRNSSSFIGGQLELRGSPRLRDGDLRLQGQFFPIGSLILPIVGTGSQHSFLPGGSEGNLCLAGAPITRLLNKTSTGQGLGIFAIPMDLAQIVIPGGVTVGQTLHFQCWYRDSLQGQATSNFSNAVRLHVR